MYLLDLPAEVANELAQYHRDSALYSTVYQSYLSAASTCAASANQGEALGLGIWHVLPSLRTEQELRRSCYTVSAWLGNVDMLAHFMDPEDINPSSHYFGRPLSAAARQGHKDVIELLLGSMRARNLPLKSHILGGIQDIQRRQALPAACLGGHIDIVQDLLKASCEQNEDANDFLQDFDKLNFSFAYAAEKNNHEIKDFVLTDCISRCDKDEFEAHLKMAFIEACESCAYDVAVLLLQQYSFASLVGPEDYDLAISSVARSGHNQMVLLLLSYRLTISPDFDRKTVNVEAITLAAERGHNSTLGIMFDYHLSSDDMEPAEDVSRLKRQLASAALLGVCSGRRVDTLSFLNSQYGFDVFTATTQARDEALLEAVRNGLDGMVRTFALAGCDLGHKIQVPLDRQCWRL
ncbi:hypothetical protein K402DRAFT_452572 [Aulographum hederae CBS 113979]|uniref:Ankyrin n=1 Tax=Aulographum hederae CBS 113979 TaxID=1176131 RepID=A0A6G1H6Y6_9PEZI|nr:hypothetical protein K402DRAFT_452572 [Aulographum hederae CBS 113979]